MATEIKFELNSEALSIRNVYEKFAHRLPVIIQVKQGHYGDIDIDTYSTGHVMRIHSYSKQRRVVARDTHGRHLSFPVNYPIKFRVARTQKKAGREQSLRDIIDQNTLPVRIELCLPPPGYSLHIGESIKQIETIGTLHLTNFYDETYLLANSINEGQLDREILYVPIYLQNLVVAVVSGIEGQPRSVFSTFQREMDEAVNDISYEVAGGNTDIAVYSPDLLSRSTENVYDYIEPTHFIKYRPTNQKRKCSAPMPNVKDLLTQLEKKQPTDGDTYEMSDGTVYSRVIVPAVDDMTPPPIPVRNIPSITENPKPKISRDNITYVNSNNPRAMVKPLEKSPSQSSQQAPEETEVPQPQSVTEHVKGFTIKQLTESLETLKLSKYADAFEEAQMSGDLLLDLSEEILKDDFQMKGYEAIKLMKYARTGYKPQ
ncbi:uncharacterized protein LOC126812429 [Patella vulgata]|uniref:uncharacterized protein LOC126812429 n=1 Tax=Patella vulgata TaxID=6465 RepID=UPI00218098FE|nr:uncharacterized protein LOC126812429 [Patella vulgata]XP_050394895.1 uncharacterized protein LOC126812429 [Patella vulgata]